MNTDYAGLSTALRPEIALVVGAMVVLGLDLSAFRRLAPSRRLGWALALGAISLLVAIGYAGLGPRGSIYGGVLRFDAFAVATRVGVLALTLLTLGLMAGTGQVRHAAEQVAVTLFAATGFILMAAAQQLLVAFLALELASLSLYVLAGFDKSRPRAAEAALKYFLFGGMAAAFLLFGFSLIYGLTGSIELPVIAARLATLPSSPLLTVAVIMILVPFGFKAAAAPFHLWAPDVYEGAPTSSAALIASASKLAGFTLFARLFTQGFGPVAGHFGSLHTAPGWMPALGLIAGASLLLGNLAALAQSNLRRLLAYSAIAHAGAMLLGVATLGYSGPGPLFYYAATYGVATVGAFGVIAVVDRAGSCQKISDLAGLYRRSPLLAGCLAIFILSLAGIPPLAGFFGKFAVFSAALQMGGVASPIGGLVLLAIALSALALYYYLRVLKQALITAPISGVHPIEVPLTARLTLLVAAALIVVCGLCPSLLLGRF